ncbi:hypothetical protein PIB30_058792 [Stylosanthes scabra]|uniref:Disease resistance protein RGA3 n=1 Tax=Stylosanthes scabra TaxID=79078 RepID=A0ABU6WND4_9FABA|nr:hypothetical protein [Stylosanthes scabra]
MGEIISGAVATLLANLTTKSFKEIALACGLRDDVEKFQSSLRIINGYLLDAENKQAKNNNVADWLKDLRKAFDEAGDILDEIEYDSKRNEVVRMYGSISMKVRRFFSYTSNPLVFRIRMAHKIKDMKQKIDQKANEGRTLGIVEQHINTPTVERNLPWRETSSSSPLRVCGRHEEKEEIIKFLMGQQPEATNVDVISIVGIGGLGKTTLAQMVYDDDRVKQHFNMLMWVCVSDDFDVKMLIQKIIHATSRTENVVDANSSLEHMVSLLNEKLRGKKFLLVLDDVWNEDHNKWDEFRNHLLKAGSDTESKGSKIIVTTRIREVVDIVGGGFSINLKALHEDECWKLFVKCAFQEESEEEKYPRLKKIGVEIVEKCKGVPLAITTLGCLLRSRPRDENEWRKIRDNEVWELDKKKKTGILPSLRLSYNHLPPEVKQCFSYCSYFPKDYKYLVIELIMFWMAHRLLQPTHEDEDAEDIGELYIKKLVSASLLQIEEDFEYSMSFKRLKMHDLVHDLAKSTMQKSSKTRTVVQEGEQDTSTEWASNKFNYLKVLHLTYIKSSPLPDDFFETTKKHLRFLNLTSCPISEKLSDSICKLQILQSLKFVVSNKNHTLPKDMKNLISLQYLHLAVEVTSLSSMNMGRFQQLKFLYLDGCSELVSVPSVVGRLTIKKFIIHWCNNLVSFEDEEEERKEHVALYNSNLQLFDIIGAVKLETLPNWLERATKLRYLRVSVTSIKSFSTRLSMASLEQLHITDCRELSSLPDNMDQTHSLQFLEIINCPILNPRYNKMTGSDWAKIAHIPRCKIDGVDQNED